jgi:DNA segregation ATPase FtsK/SpoIIIE-like protein
MPAPRLKAFRRREPPVILRYQFDPADDVRIERRQILSRVIIRCFQLERKSCLLVIRRLEMLC